MACIAYAAMRAEDEGDAVRRLAADPTYRANRPDGTQWAYALRDYNGKVRADLKALEAMGLVRRDDWRWLLVAEAV